jgi:hemerythrin superfamily protein
MTESHDVIQLLTEDHRAIVGLAERLDAAEDPTVVKDLFLHVVERLAAHEAAETQVLFPAVRASSPAGAGEATSRMNEHDEINELLAEMRSLPPDGLAFAKRASALLLDIQNHFQAEEDDLFPRLTAAMQPIELFRLGAEVHRVMEHAPAFPAEPPKARLL